QLAWTPKLSSLRHAPGLHFAVSLSLHNNRVGSMRRELMKVHGRLLSAVAALLFSLTSHAQGSQTNATCTNPSAQGALLDEVHTIADPSQGVPVECTLTVSNTGTYKVTLTDLGIQPGNPSVPAPLDSVKLQVTQGTTLVGTALTAPGTTQFDSQ